MRPSVASIIARIFWASRGLPAGPEDQEVSIFRMRIRTFKRCERAYRSFLILLAAYLISFVLPLLINDQAILVVQGESYYFPIVKDYPSSQFGLNATDTPNYRELKRKMETHNNGDWLLMPPYPYSPTESFLQLSGSPPHPPSRAHILGTDDRARDVFARLAYGFNVSMTFALLVAGATYMFGVLVGAALGYFGGMVDIIGQRVLETWSGMPFLYIVIIISSIVVPTSITAQRPITQRSFWLLIIVFAAFEWVDIARYVRGEFYREKAKDYVAAAIALGAPSHRIIFRHILPNALTPVFSLAPFAVVANITALVSIDFLGFGLPPPTPSWGELLNQGMNYLSDWWLVASPLSALFVTLLLIAFIGDGIREALAPAALRKSQ